MEVSVFRHDYRYQHSLSPNNVSTALLSTTISRILVHLVTSGKLKVVSGSSSASVKRFINHSLIASAFPWSVPINCPSELCRWWWLSRIGQPETYFNNRRWWWCNRILGVLVVSFSGVHLCGAGYCYVLSLVRSGFHFCCFGRCVTVNTFSAVTAPSQGGH